MKSVIERWKQKTRDLKKETLAIYLAYKDPRVPWYAKLLAACVVGYALSPIDLIPDPIPILGYLDDLVIVPLGIALVVRMIPPEVLQECRQKFQCIAKRRWRDRMIEKGAVRNRVAAILAAPHSSGVSPKTAVQHVSPGGRANDSAAYDGLGQRDPE